MRYLITSETMSPFLTNWFDAENNFNEEIGMVVFDLYNLTYTYNGYTWTTIQEDHL